MCKFAYWEFHFWKPLGNELNFQTVSKLCRLEVYNFYTSVYTNQWFWKLFENFCTLYVHNPLLATIIHSYYVIHNLATTIVSQIIFIAITSLYIHSAVNFNYLPHSYIINQYP